MLKPDVVFKRSDCFFWALLTYKHQPEPVPRAASLLFYCGPLSLWLPIPAEASPWIAQYRRD